MLLNESLIFLRWNSKEISLIMTHNILLFADRLPPLPGGMEVHAGYFIDHFSNHPEFLLTGVITKNASGKNFLISNTKNIPIDNEDISRLYSADIVFFNSGRWIEELEQIRKLLPTSKFIYRTGGNEVIKAPLIYNQIPDHSLRQAYWATTLNETIDLMITNSAYTETRLREVGLFCPFTRVVGGVNNAALKARTSSNKKFLTIFCAARFVPYKGHALLIDLIHKLMLKGHNLRVRLAGDGPLLAQVQSQVHQYELGSVVRFLGVLDNKETCQEISQADIYMQLSSDYLTEVEGGTYIHSEGMGRSILEALTAGTFVISGQSGALPEIVTKNRGVLLDLHNIEELVDNVEIILKNLPLQQPFMTEYCWTRVFKRYEEIFKGSL